MPRRTLPCRRGEGRRRPQWRRALRAPVAVVLRPARIAGLSAEAAVTPAPIVITPDGKHGRGSRERPHSHRPSAPFDSCRMAFAAVAAEKIEESYISAGR